MTSVSPLTIPTYPTFPSLSTPLQSPTIPLSHDPFRFPLVSLSGPSRRGSSHADADGDANRGGDDEGGGHGEDGGDGDDGDVDGNESDTTTTHTHARTSASAPPKKRARRNSAGEREKRERCANACNRCKAKKLKCFFADESRTTCAACNKSSADCVFEIPAPKHAGGEKYIMALESRVAKLEHALAQIDPLHPEINDHYNPSDSPPRSESTGGRQGTHRPVDQFDETPSFTFAKIVKSALQHRGHTVPPMNDPTGVLQPGSTVQTPTNPNPCLPSPSVAEEMLTAVYLHIQGRYAFIDYPRLRAWHDRRESICFAGPTAPLDDQIGAFFIWMMYASGVSFARSEPTLESAETYLEQAMRYVETVITPHDLTSVRALLMLIFFAFRAPSGPPMWHVCGFAMRLCVELGLHRSRSNKPYQTEIRKRLFWSTYCFDRLICLSSGRPFNLVDKDIDVELPVDVDVECTDDATILALQQAQAAGSPPPYTVTGKLTTMTSAIHSARIYRIRSRIQAEFFTIDAPAPTREGVEGFLTELEDWRRSIPSAKPKFPCQEKARFHMTYFQGILFCLRPAVTRVTPTDPLLVLCATAAAEACESIRKVHQAPGTKPQPLCSLYHIFICGMTLLHCLSVVPNVVSSRVSSRAIRACSSTLAIYAQQFPAAVPFRELFEHMADEVLNESQCEATTSAIGQLLMGNYDKISAIYDTISNKNVIAPMPVTAGSIPESAPMYAQTIEPSSQTMGPPVLPSYTTSQESQLQNHNQNQAQTQNQSQSLSQSLGQGLIPTILGPDSMSMGDMKPFELTLDNALSGTTATGTPGNPATPGSFSLDFAALHNFTDLTSMFDFPPALEEGLGGWQADWTDPWGTLR